MTDQVESADWMWRFGILCEDIAWVSINGVFGLDWVMLIPDGPAKLKSKSRSGISVQGHFGIVTEETRQKLELVKVGGSMTFSACLGWSQEEALRQDFVLREAWQTGVLIKNHFQISVRLNQRHVLGLPFEIGKKIEPGQWPSSDQASNTNINLRECPVKSEWPPQSCC